MKLVLAPGQGSQKPGFLSGWLEDPLLKDWLGLVGETIGMDLIRHGSRSDAKTLRDTRLAQPLIVAGGIMVYYALARKLDKNFTITLDQPLKPLVIPGGLGVAGHSVGEITAAALAGVLTPGQALEFINLRSEGMARASATYSTGLSAILGGREVESHLRDLGLRAANFNGAGQIVAGGLEKNLSRLVQNPPRSARVISLSVAGAFHTPFMRPAQIPLARLAKGFSPRNPSPALWSNRDGQRVEDGPLFLRYLVEQVSRPVRWDKCQKSFNRAGIAKLVELAPAGTLINLARRSFGPDQALALDAPADLDSVATLLTDGSD